VIGKKRGRLGWWLGGWGKIIAPTQGGPAEGEIGDRKKIRETHESEGIFHGPTPEAAREPQTPST